jgi:excisionase family DNA binding protein
MREIEKLTLAELMPIKEAQKVTGYSNMTVMRMIHEGRLQSLRIGNRIMLARHEVDGLVEAKRTAIPNDGHVYYTVADVAKLAGCTRANVYDGIVRGTIQAIRVDLGTRLQYVIRDDEVKRWMERKRDSGLGNGSEQAAAGA